MLNINLVDLFNQIKDLVANYKVVFAQLLDLIKNPTVLLRLAVAKLDAFANSEFFNKFYMLGVFIAGFTGGAVIFGTVKTFNNTKNIIAGGRLVEQTNNIKNSVKRYNLAEELLIDAEKTGGLIGGTSGYKWIGLENDIWLPLRRGNVGGVSKVVAEGGDINWHILTGNYNEARFVKVVDGIEDIGLREKVLVRRNCYACLFPVPTLGITSFYKYFLGIQASASTYECVDYHGKNSNGLKSVAPQNGQNSLKNAQQIKSTSSRKIAVEGDKFAVFDEHIPDKFHGHTRNWDQLTQEMKNHLINTGKTNSKGKIL